MDAPSTQADLRLSITNRQILQIALPIAAAILVPQINFITNNIFLGALGEQALAVAGITGVYYLIFAVIGMGLNNGLQALISRRAGENRVDAIGNLFSQGVRIALIVAAGGIFVTYCIAPIILQWSLHNKQNYQLSMDFLYIRIWGLPFLYIYQMRNALLVGTNNSRLLIIGTLAETVTNIVLDYGLINGKLGFPKLGFNGAAIASIVAEAIGMIVVLFSMRLTSVTKHLKLFKNLSYNKENTKLILTISSPLILQYALSIISWEFFYILIEHHGKRELAVSNTMRNIFGFFGCFIWAFAATTNTMVSNIIGQGLHERVNELIQKIVRLSLFAAFGVAILLNVFPTHFLKIYGQGDEFIQVAIPVLRIVTIALIIMSFSHIWLNAVVGTGNSKRNLLTETIAIAIYCVYNFIALEVLNKPITWAWASEWLYWMLLFLPSFWYMKSGKWKQKKI